MRTTHTVPSRGRQFVAAYAPPFLGAVWLAAAWAKITRPDDSVAAISAGAAELGMTTPIGAWWLLVGIIAIEVILGFGLIFSVAPAPLVSISGGVLVAFSIWLGFLVARIPEAPCGCGLRLGWWEGGASAHSALIRNLALLVIHAGVLMCLIPGRWRMRVDPVSIA